MPLRDLMNQVTAGFKAELMSDESISINYKAFLRADYKDEKLQMSDASKKERNEWVKEMNQEKHNAERTNRFDKEKEKQRAKEKAVMDARLIDKEKFDKYFKTVSNPMAVTYTKHGVKREESTITPPNGFRRTMTIDGNEQALDLYGA